jgi:hypothetical protein
MTSMFREWELVVPFLGWFVAVLGAATAETHEVVHGRGNKFPARRNAHVCIGIGHTGL